MTSIVILTVSALVCAIGVVLFALLAIKFRDEEPTNVFLIIAALICVGGCGWCISEAIKRSDNHDKRQSYLHLDVDSGKHKYAHNSSWASVQREVLPG